VHNGQIVEGIAIAHHRPNHDGGSGGGGDDGGDPPTPPPPVAVETCFSFIFSSGASWGEAESYLFNPAGGPSVGITDLNAALVAWDAEVDASIFGDGTETSLILSADTGRRSAPDDLNEVYFASIKGPGSSSTIASTVVWTTSTTIVEWDMVFNTNFSWATDGSSNAMDFLNIAAHEAGHAAGMGHTETDAVCAAQTMYPTGSNGETDKRDLGKGDIAGVNVLYN
jgi:hypothetical protein